jgi:hypothetical protein
MKIIRPPVARFEGGVQLLVRNGDVGGPVSYGAASRGR